PARRPGLKGGGPARHAGAQGEAVDPGAAVHVEPVRAVPEEPVVWPARAREDRPVEAEAHEAELAPVRVPRQRQVRLARRHVPEAQRIVQEKEAEMSRTPRETCQKLEDVLAMSLADPVRAEKLHRADSSLDAPPPL